MVASVELVTACIAFVIISFFILTGAAMDARKIWKKRLHRDDLGDRFDRDSERDEEKEKESNTNINK